MKANIYVIFGASGSGKTALLHEIRKSDILHSINTKFTTRNKRDYDDDEIQTAEEEIILNQEFFYQRYGIKYAINTSQIDLSIENSNNHFIVCNDITTIIRLKEKYLNSVSVIFLSFDAPRKAIAEIIQTRNISDDELKLRLQKIDSLYNEFISNRELFNHVILNKFGAPPIKRMFQLRRIIESEVGLEAFGFVNIQNELLNINNKISDLETAIINSGINLKAEIQDNYVFIVMAMMNEEPQLIDVLNSIKRACSELGKVAERVDDYIHKSEITYKMLGSIKTAEYVIADLTHSRPNVYYELGYAHAYGKKVIITAKSGTRPHFDIRNYNIIFYNTLTELESNLKMYIEKYDKSEK